MSVRLAKTQISLGIHPVWSESLLSAWRKLGSLATHWAHSKDSNPPSLIWVFAGCTLTLLVLSCRGSYVYCTTIKIKQIHTPKNLLYSYHTKIWRRWLYHRVLHPKDAKGLANSIDPDQTSPLGAVWGAVWYGSILFAQICLSKKLRPLLTVYTFYIIILSVQYA